MIYKRQNKKGLLIKSSHICEENECGKERSAPQTQYTPMKQNDNNTNPAEKRKNMKTKKATFWKPCVFKENALICGENEAAQLLVPGAATGYVQETEGVS